MLTDSPAASLAQAIFSPRSIALVGASADPAKYNARPQRFLRDHGYAGCVFPVNPGRKEIFGVRAFPDLRSIPGRVDHAFIMVPAAGVPEVLAQCRERGVPVATIFSAGFAELGEEGLARQREMVRQARAGGLRLIGPNCMGIISVPDATPLTVNAVLGRELLKAGPLSVISQSGSMLGTLLSRAQARGLGFARLVSVGNECDLGVGEIANLLVDDPHTGAILLFLETFRDAEHLARAARRAAAAGQPVIAYKLGRSAVGRQVANSHTGAMTGPDELADAFFRAHGIIRVAMIESLFEAPRLVMGHRPPSGRRVNAVTGTGGAAAMVVDRLGVLGIDVAAPPARVIANLAARGIPVAPVPLTDIPMVQGSGARYTAVLSELLGSRESDAVVAVVGSSAQSGPAVITDRILKAENRGRKPLAVFLAPRADEGLRLLEENGVAGFRTPETCADALCAYLNWRAPAEPFRAPPAALAAAEAFLARTDHARLNERDSHALFGALGIPTAGSCVVTEAAPEIPVPRASDAAGSPSFALKVLSADIAHKTDAGLVRLDVPAREARAEAAKLLETARRARPDARIDGVLVQRMERGLAEAIVGFRRDPEVGPMVMLGMGGVAAELRRSLAVRIAPVGPDEALRMIDEIPEMALLTGYRNLPRGDVTALARAVSAFSMLAALTSRPVLDAEVNPLIVKRDGEGVVAVDGLAVLG
ncbi:MAG: acetate--CoA ligase family protein [Burkholderiales bacterium]|nr:acetate--CoA ligase family protein [Burkholderiales bacterium]